MYAQKTDILRNEGKSDMQSNAITDGVSLHFGTVWLYVHL